MGNLESLINLTFMSLDCERKPKYQRDTRTDTERTYKLLTKRPGHANCTVRNVQEQFSVCAID